VTFGLVSFHLVGDKIVPAAGVPLLYAAAMAAGAVAALLTGEAYDRVGARVLLALPVLVAAVPPLAFAGGLPAVIGGVLLWGAAVGLQDSTVKALVADLVRPDRRATAYGLFAAVQGAGALAGGIATGALYEHSTTALVIAVVASQVLAAALLVPLCRRGR
jgi:MFS family permease